PTLAQAKQRVDNMAAGWLKAGAAAVVAEGHFGPAWYVRQLFTTHKTVDQIFHDSPTYNDNAFSFASSRTPGATAEMDPDGSPGGYWRSVTGHLDTPTDDITGAAYADTGTDPADFEVPGAASVEVGGAPVFADPSLGEGGAATANLAPGTKLRLTDRSATTTPDGGPVLAVATLDGATSGWMSAADLVPRDSASPVVWSSDDGDGAFSPNGDGSGDSYTVTGRISESAIWTARFESAAGALLGTSTGSGDSFSATWSGIVAGTAVPDGTYRWEVTVRDGWGNPDGTKSGTFVADTVAPAFDDVVIAAADAPGGVPTFSPNGDGSADSIGFGYSTNEPGYVDLTVSDADGATVRGFATRVSTGPGRVTWDGLDDAGHVVRNGVYTVSLAPRDHAGNVGAARDSTIAVYKSLSHVASLKTVFFPQDLDKYARTARFSFDLSASATVSGVIRNEAGGLVRTMFDAVPMAAGSHLFDWDGRRTDGSMAPRGTYTAAISATDGVLSATGLALVVADGFRITVNDTTPGRGQTIVLYATSPELLKTLPRVKVSQSGTSAFSLTMTKTGSYGYRVTIKLKKTGRAGTVRFSLSGTDGSGRVNRATRSFVLH
ncbi:MAG: FlgD immunoglobulin-like domain containing protein, partial [Candidatus Limnocylindrales bacterium]